MEYTSHAVMCASKTRDEWVLYAPLMLPYAVESCSISPEHVSTINNLIEKQGRVVADDQPLHSLFK